MGVYCIGSFALGEFRVHVVYFINVALLAIFVAIHIYSMRESLCLQNRFSTKI